MMKQEFEQCIGLVITSEEYTDIEAAYMGLPESVDKDKFVKIWLKEGGIQDLFDKRLLRVSQMKKRLRDLEESYSEQAEFAGKIMALKDKLGHCRCGNGGSSVVELEKVILDMLHDRSYDRVFNVHFRDEYAKLNGIDAETAGAIINTLVCMRINEKKVLAA
jgi:hypothetical protein